MKEKAAVFALGRFEWDFFGTFTFVRDDVPCLIRRKYWFALLRQLAGNAAVHFLRLVWILRSELGESTERFHYHALIGGLPHHAVTELTCFALMAQWEHQRPLIRRKAPNGNIRLLSEVCGMARVRVFNPRMDGLDYCIQPEGCVKGKASQSGNSGRDQYEAKKFGGADTVEYSNSLRAWLYRQGVRPNSATQRYTDSAVTSQRRQSSVGASCQDIGECDDNSPALSPCAAVKTHASAKDQFSTEAPRCGVLTGDRKSAWQDNGDGTFDLVDLARQ